MTLVPNAGKYCVLACLESLLADLGKRKTWEEIRNILEPNGICNQEGVVWTTEGFVKGCKLLNLYAKRVPLHFPVSETYRDGSLFIFFTSGSLHCVRFYDQPEERKILVMDPDYVKNHGTLRWIDHSEFSSVGPEFIQVKIDNGT